MGATFYVSKSKIGQQDVCLISKIFKTIIKKVAWKITGWTLEVIKDKFSTLG